jgi:hypothetical protein
MVREIYVEWFMPLSLLRGHRVAVELLDPSVCMREVPHDPTGNVEAR